MANLVVPAALAAVAAIAAVALSSKKAGASEGDGEGADIKPGGTTPPSATDETPPDSVLARVTEALASGSVAMMRNEAARLRADGWTLHAAQLEEAAKTLEALNGGKKPPAPAPQPQQPAAIRTLQEGMSGADVSAWQAVLVADGLSLGAAGIDGKFGPATTAATKTWQSRRGLTADGKVGPATRAKIGTTYTPPKPAPQPAPPQVIPVPSSPPIVVVKPPAPPPPPVVVVAPSLPPVSIPVAPRTLTEGMSGADVSAWQAVLLLDGLSLGASGVDGKFGPATTEATRTWQARRGLVADGKVGPATLAKMGTNPTAAAPIGRVLQQGMSGEDVLAWQLVLQKDGLLVPAGVDGAFGAQTTQATKTWQSRRGLVADGKVGPATLQAAAASVAAPAPAPVKSTVPSINRTTWRPTLQSGMAGNDVREWQTVLLADGYSLGAAGADGDFGPITVDATKAWQTAKKLAADGKVGPGTRAAIVGGSKLTVIAGELGWHTPLPGLLAPMAPRDVVAPDRSLASKTAAMLLNSKPGTEDRRLVQQFQKQEGVHATGYYGPGTALALARYGLVPPKPFYWSTSGTSHIKRNYRKKLLQLAAQDPQRADEWTSAALVA